MGFQKLFLFWIAGIIFKGWEAELEMGVVIGKYCYRLVVWYVKILNGKNLRNTIIFKQKLHFFHQAEKAYQKC